MNSPVPESDDISSCSSFQSDGVGGLSEFDGSELASQGAASSASNTDRSDCESLFPEAPGDTDASDTEGTAPSWPLPPPTGERSEEGMREWRSSWQRFVNTQGDTPVPFDEVPQLLLRLCKTVPCRLAGYFAGLAGVDEVIGAVGECEGECTPPLHPPPHTDPRPASSTSVGSPTTSGLSRRRDLLPLPQPVLSAEDMPGENSQCEGLAGKRRCRHAWVLLMIACINYHYFVGADASSMPSFHGPATAAQRAAHLRLAVAADALVDRAPDDVVFQDWTSDLRSTSVSYTGEEVQTCHRTEAELLEPGLPPKALTGSIALADLCEGRSRDALLHPLTFRKGADEPVTPWPRPRIHTASKDEEYRALALLYNYGILDGQL